MSTTRLCINTHNHSNNNPGLFPGYQIGRAKGGTKSCKVCQLAEGGGDREVGALAMLIVMLKLLPLPIQNTEHGTESTQNRYNMV